MSRRKQVYPLAGLPADTQERIRLAVADDRPPSRWLRVGAAQIESRAWWEWHWQRGIDPEKRRRPLPPWLRQLVLARDGLVCGLCGGDVAPTDVHIDHIKPVALGGTDEFSNLQIAHSLCNIKKGARH